MKAELVQCKTSDGVALDGAFFEAAGTAPKERAVDAFLLMHGSSGNYYNKLLLSVGEGLREAGYPSASFNNRGHDLVWGQPGNLMGNSFDILDFCRLDIRACIDWLASRGYKRVGLFGHSMGAVKVAYYQAREKDSRVGAVVSSSPVRLSHSYFMGSEAASEHKENVEWARSMVEKGQPEALRAVNFPMPHLFGAKAYLDKHGPEERYNLMRHVRDIKCPLLMMAGSKEDHPRLRDCARDMYGLVNETGRARLIIQEGADHGYTGMLDKLTYNVVGWVRGLEGAKAGTRR